MRCPSALLALLSAEQISASLLVRMAGHATLASQRMVRAVVDAWEDHGLRAKLIVGGWRAVDATL